MANAKPRLIKKVQNAVLYEGYTIKILNVRASYPHLDRPYAGEDGGVPAFSITGLLDKKTHKAAYQLITKAIQDIMTENKIKVATDKRCLRDGDDSGKEENEGNWTISARETKRPKVRYSDNELVPSDEIADAIYGGCYVDLMIRLWVQNNKWGKRVNANLLSVRFNEDGEPFGEGRVDDEDMWDDDEDEGFEEEEAPRRSGKKPARRGRDEEEEEYEDEGFEEEEEDEDPEPRRPSKKPQSRRPAPSKSSRRARDEALDDDDL